MTTKEYVIEEAAKLFLEHGIKSVRMDDIASHCSVSKRTIYELFENREHLMELAMEFLLCRLDERLNELAANATNVLEEFWIIFSYSLPNQEKVNRMLYELNKHHTKVYHEIGVKHYENTLRQNRARLTRAATDGFTLPQLNVENFAYTFTNYIFGLPGAGQGQQIDLKTAIIVYMRGMSTEKGREYIDKNLLKIA